MKTQQEKCLEFQALHQGEDCFFIPNPWDIGSARLLEGMGFKALATTSQGFALTLGKHDGGVSLEEKLKHCRELAESTNVPVNVDFEDGYANAPEQVAHHVRQLIETGVAGCSIEDFSRVDQQLFDFNLSIERVQAASEVIADSGLAFQLTARAENMIRGVNNLEDTIQRLQAYEKVGADVLYAPGIASLEDLATVTAQLSIPFNVLGAYYPNASLEDFAKAGAKRVSVGSALAWVSIKPLLEAGSEMMERGTMTWLSGMANGKQVRTLLDS